MQEISHKKSLVKQNILQVIEYKGISKYEFYKKTRITRGVLDQNNGMSEENIARFLAYFTDIDANWLLTGNGLMLRDQSEGPPNQAEVIRLLKEKIHDQQEIITLLKEKIDVLQWGASESEADSSAAAGCYRPRHVPYFSPFIGEEAFFSRFCVYFSI